MITRKLFRQILFIVWTVLIYLIFASILFDFKLIQAPLRVLFFLGLISLITYLALGTADDKI